MKDRTVYIFTTDNGGVESVEREIVYEEDEGNSKDYLNTEVPFIKLLKPKTRDEKIDFVKRLKIEFPEQDICTSAGVLFQDYDLEDAVDEYIEVVKKDSFTDYYDLEDNRNSKDYLNLEIPSYRFIKPETDVEKLNFVKRLAHDFPERNLRNLVKLSFEDYGLENAVDIYEKGDD